MMTQVLLEREEIPEDQYSGLRQTIASGEIEGESYSVCVGTGGLSVEFDDHGMAKRSRFPLQQMVQAAYRDHFEDGGGDE